MIDARECGSVSYFKCPPLRPIGLDLSATVLVMVQTLIESI